ncbi:aKG-HExxH-type peptide beta-hydroxylase [Actinophytocola sp. NPDC049390]|uniref:aKG-HExxH-type peptide beta-hydroxylase n=1 Tax=Actinophytocola sp. NPDC049390 TaxID=3363894 RepID=UPI0037AE2EB9
MRLLEAAQHSHRRLRLRALLDRLEANPAAMGTQVDIAACWAVLAEAEARDADATADIFLHPSVGVWLTRALHHHARPDVVTPWSELGYLHAIAAAAAVRTGVARTIRVPVWHGVVSLPTVGHVTLPGSFPVGTADVVSAGIDTHLRVSPSTSIALDGSDEAFFPARRHTSTSHGLTVDAWLDHHDPYHGFGPPSPPTELSDVDLADWRKLVDEAWHVLTRDHRPYAREIATGLRLLVPIEPSSGTVGESSPSAFGGVRLSACDSATEFAEALVHEMQHSKLNALLDLVKLTDGHRAQRYLAPWRDDPRPLTGVLHGLYAFTCGVEFWLAEADVADENEQIRFEIAFRRTQVRHALRALDGDPHLTNAGRALVDAVSARLEVCERTPVLDQLSTVVTAMVDDHQALWRLRHARPNPEVVDAVAAAWCADRPPPTWADRTRISAEDTRRLPANRRNLLHVKAVDRELFTSLTRGRGSLPGSTPYADAAFCTGDMEAAADAYHRHLTSRPDDVQAWVGLGLALRAQGRDAASLLDRPELTVAVHRRIRVLTGRAPDPLAMVAWLAPATAASCRSRSSP